MADSESRRLDLYNRLQEVLGAEPATTLMTYLPPIQAEDLLTKQEFSDLKTEFADFKTEMRAFKREMGHFKREMSEFRSEVNQRFDRLLLAVVGGMFVVLAAVLGTNVFS